MMVFNFQAEIPEAAGGADSEPQPQGEDKPGGDENAAPESSENVDSGQTLEGNRY